MTSLFKKMTYALCLIVCGLTASAQADVLSDAMERGSIRVGVALFAPWTMKDGKEQLSGFDVDVARKIAADMGIDAQLKVYSWEELTPALQKGEIDFIAAGMAITPKRALEVEFSAPYAESGVGLVANTKNTKNINSFAGLNAKGKRIAMVQDTVAYDLSQSLFAKADRKVYETGEAAEQAVVDGKVDAYVASVPVTKFLALSHPKELDLPLNAPLLSYHIGFGVKKGEQGLLNFLNAWTLARVADKWLPATGNYWFDSLDWSKEAQ